MLSIKKLLNNGNSKIRKTALCLVSAVIIVGSGFAIEHAHAKTHDNQIQQEQLKDNIVEEKATNDNTEEQQKKAQEEEQKKAQEEQEKKAQEEQEQKAQKEKEEQEQKAQKEKEEKTQKEQEQREQQKKKEQEKKQEKKEQEKKQEKKQKQEQIKETECNKADNNKQSSTNESIYNHPCNNISCDGTNLAGMNPNSAVAVTPEIRSLTKQVVGNTTDQREQARRIYNWITSNISYDNSLDTYATQHQSYNGRCNASTVLANRASVCTGFSSLFTAMCRVVGLPTQMVVGYYYSCKGTWDCHCWNKVLVNGTWIKVDPTIGRLYNCFGTGNFDSRHRESFVYLTAN